MSDFAASAALVLTVACLLTIAAALIIKSLNEGSLQADIKFARNAMSIYLGKNKTYNR